ANENSNSNAGQSGYSNRAVRQARSNYNQSPHANRSAALIATQKYGDRGDELSRPILLKANHFKMELRFTELVLHQYSVSVARKGVPGVKRIQQEEEKLIRNKETLKFVKEKKKMYRLYDFAKVVGIFLK